jgi:hypothetical protein
VAALTASLRSLAWPTTTRERPAVRADKYFTLQRPMTRFTVEEGTKARLNAGKVAAIIVHAYRSVIVVNYHHMCVSCIHAL